MKTLKADQAVISAELADKDKKTFAKTHFNVDALASQPYPFFTWFGHIHEHQLTAEIVDGPKVIGYLTIRFHDIEMHKASVKSLTFIGIIFIVALMLEAVFIAFLQTIVTGPIRQLSAIARKVTGSNNYALRAKKIYADETGALTEDFNTMLNIIEQRTHNLEERVQSRTHELEHQNKLLEQQIAATARSEESWRESEARFQQAFFKAPIGMALVDADFQVFSRNKRFNKLLEIPENTNPRLKELMPDADWQAIKHNMSQLVSGEIAHCEQNIFCQKNTGLEIHAILSMSAVKNTAKEFRYAVIQLQDVTESRVLAAELEHQATHDALTGLANRRLLKRTLSVLVKHLSQDDDTHSLCILDLDQFKVVNDTCGHTAGDELLKQVAKLLKNHMRNDDLVARLGGDEFALILYQCDAEQARKIAETLRREIERMIFNWDSMTFRVGVSIGVTVLRPQVSNVSEAIKEADAACYAAKDAGRNRVYVIDGEDQSIKERHGESRWVQRLQYAIDNNQFVLFSQPIIDFHDDQTHQHQEILIRLKNPADGSIVSPASFLPVAERYGLSNKIDQWVVEQLIDNLTNKKLPASEHNHYWINLSGVSMGDDDFIHFLEHKIRNANLPAGVINFEITETAVIKNITKASQLMLNLKSMGCNFALDDFGSGVSSFGYLKNLPVEHIKIDGMFVKDILIDEVDLIFVKSIIDIAAAMGIKTVAEFVETLEIRDKLIELGADFGQGYALGKPEPLLPESRQ